jgi:hypothetical protein
MISPENAQSNRQVGLQLEYATLRDEIIKRIELRTQILFGTLTLAGVLFGFASSKTLGVLAYPIVAAFLATAWSQNDIALKHAAKYITSCSLCLCGEIPKTKSRASRPSLIISISC